MSPNADERLLRTVRHPPRAALRPGIAVALAVTLLAAGCGSTSAADKATEKQRAAQLVAAAHIAGVAPHLTVGIAESLYGTDAPGVCKVFEDGLTTAERNDLLGNPSGRRTKTITTHAIAYGRLVVKAYCPEQLSNYDAAVNGLDPIESDD